MLLRLLTVLLALACAGGCAPAARPVWHPDSKSFFYSRPDGAVVRYDLATGGARAIVPAGRREAGLPALSPDAARLAYAEAAVSWDGESREVRLGIVPLASGETVWAGLKGGAAPDARRASARTACHWCPTGRRILVWYQHPGEAVELLDSSRTSERFAVYDAETGELTELRTAPPAMTFGQMLNVSPLCPDGSGYLAVRRTGENTSGFLFVGWDGWEYPIAVDEGIGAPSHRRRAAPTEGEDWRNHLPLPHAAWSGPVLKFATPDGECSIDTAARRITVAELPAAKREEFDAVAAADAADGAWGTARVVPLGGGGLAIHFRCKPEKGTSPARVELVDARRRRRRVLLEGTLPENNLASPLVPSPDGRHVLVFLRDAGGKDRIHVVRPDGTVGVSLDAAK